MRIPTRRYANRTAVADFNVELSYADATQLPAGTPAEIMGFAVEGVAKALEELSKDAAATAVAPALTVKLTVREGHDGLVTLMSAEASLAADTTAAAAAAAGASSTDAESTDAQDANSESGNADTAATSDNSGTDSTTTAAATNNTTASTAAAGGDKKTAAQRKIALTVRPVLRGVHAMSANDHADAASRLREIDAREQLRRRTAEARNALESLIYAARDELEVT